MSETDIIFTSLLSPYRVRSAYSHWIVATFLAELQFVEYQVAMMQHERELVRIIIQDTGQARRPPLSVELFKAPRRRQGGLITHHEGRHER